MAEGVGMVSSVPYEVVRHLGDAELRRYGTWLLATVYDLDEDEAFQMLFRYILTSTLGQIEIRES